MSVATSPSRSLLLVGLALGLLAGLGCKKAKARNDSNAEATEVVKATVALDGVTDETIKLGQVASFTGAQAGLGAEAYRGMLAYFMELNSKGGVHGRKIEVVPADDKYTADGAEAATDKIMNEEKVFAVMMASGTEPTAGILKSLKKVEAKKPFLWGSTSGAEVSRAGEYAPLAFNIRGSLKGSGKDIIEAYATAGFKKIGIVTQDDGFGKSAAAAARKAAEDKGMTVVLEVPISKTTKPDGGNAHEIITKLKAAGAEALVLAATYNPSTVIVRDAREAGWQVPAATMGTPDTMLRQLVAHEKKTGKRMTNAVLGALNTPPVNATDLPAVREYRELVDKRNPRLPTEIADPNYRPLRYSSNAFEGFLSARVFGEALERAGKTLTRDSLRRAAESIVAWDPGVGQKVTFGANDNQGFESIWLAGIKNDEFSLVTDMKKYLTDKPEPVSVAKDDTKGDKGEKVAAGDKAAAATNAKAATPAPAPAKK